jgi:hypothetical protein
LEINGALLVVVMVYYCVLLDECQGDGQGESGRHWCCQTDRQTDRQTDCRAPTGGGPADDISFSFLGFFRTLTMISAPPPDVLVELGSSPLSPTTATATTTLHASSHTAQYSSKIPERAGHALLAGPVYHTEKRNGSKYKIF